MTALTPAEVPAEETPTPAVPPRITPAIQLAKPTSPSIPKTALAVVPSRPDSQPPKDPEPVSETPPLLDDPSRDEADLSNNPNPRQSNGPSKDDGPQHDGHTQQIEGPQQDQGPLQDEGPQQNESLPQDDGFLQDQNSQQGDDNSQQEGGGRSDSQLDGSPQGDGGGSRQNIAPHPKEGTDTPLKSNTLQEGGAESNFQQENGGGSDSAGRQDGNSHPNQGVSNLGPDNNPSQNNGRKDPQQVEGSLGRLILKAFDPDGQGASSVLSSFIDDAVSETAKGAATVILSNGVLSLVTPAAVNDGGISNNRNPPPPQAAESRVLTLAGQTGLATPSATPLAGADDILPAGQSILISDTPVRLGSSGTFFVDGSSIPLHGTSGPLPESIFIVEGQSFTPNPTGLVLAGSNVVPDCVPITISNIPISLGLSDTLLVGGDAISFLNPLARPSLPPNSVFLVGGEVFRAHPIGFTVAGSKVLPGGAPVTVSGTPVSLDPSGTLFLGSTPIPLGPTPLNPTNSIFLLGGEAFAPKSTGFIIAGSIVLPGGPPTTVSGTRISLNPSGELILGDSTMDLKKNPPATALTVGGQAFTANPLFLLSVHQPFSQVARPSRYPERGFPSTDLAR